MRRTFLVMTMIVMGIAFAFQAVSDCAAQPKKETAAETNDKAGFDVLIGVYFQAATRQSFDIFFTRMK